MLYAQAVARGMRKLNTGQLMDVNLRTLNMDDVRHCVLGQLFGNYFEGLDTIGITHEDSVHYGFNTTRGVLAMKVLTWQWKRSIKRALA